MSAWTLIGVMPNFPGNQTWDFGNHAFANKDDTRLEAICHSSPAARVLLERFSNAFADKFQPVAFICSEACPDELRSGEALVDLRNAFALSAVLRGSQDAIGNPNVWHPRFTDYFDIYPLLPSKDRSSLLSFSFAGTSVHMSDKFHGQAYPDITCSDTHLTVEVDDKLLPLLIDAWQTKHLAKRANWKSTAIFRSLATAYRAARVPKGSDLLILDVGVQISLWVSALECLAHPGHGGLSGLNQVLALLAKRKWSRSALTVRRRQVLRRGAKRGQLSEPLTYTQHLYRRLYDARNDFLHGNPIREENAFLGPRTRNTLAVEVAPLIYASALQATLAPAPATRLSARDAFVRAIQVDRLESALLASRMRRGIERFGVDEPDRS